MPGRDETKSPGSPQGLDGTACKETPDAVEPLASTGQSIALVALLVCACILVVSPAAIAAMSMVDATAFDQTSTWLQRLSPITSQLDHAKVILVGASAFIVSRADEA
jgi:hypothetical protein